MKEIKYMIELRDLFIILVLIFLSYQQLQIQDLKSKIKTLYYGEQLQNEINTEIIKRFYLYEIKLER